MQRIILWLASKFFFVIPLGIYENQFYGINALREIGIKTIIIGE